MSDLFDSLNATLTPEIVYCLGGLISAKETHACSDNKTAWILPIRHNPKQVTNTQLKLHKKNVKKIVTAYSGTILTTQSANYKKWFSQNKDGFIAVFYSSNTLDYDTLISNISQKLLSASDNIKRAFLVGAFDGRSSWDKHSKKIVLDCNSNRSAELFRQLLDYYSIKYDYNIARDRKSGGRARQPQLRISSQNVPAFMKTIGLISPARIRAIENAMQGQSLPHHDDNVLPGLISLYGLRISKNPLKIPALPSELIEQTKRDDQTLQNDINHIRIKKKKSKATYAGVPKEKPKIQQGSKKSPNYPRDKNVSLNALDIAEFKCEFSDSHPTFIRKRDSLPYTELHHLVPLEYHGYFDVSLDVEENIVSLCSNCHNQLHYGADIETILEPLFKRRKRLLAYTGILITYEELLKMYKKIYH